MDHSVQPAQERIINYDPNTNACIKCAKNNQYFDPTSAQCVFCNASSIFNESTDSCVLCGNTSKFYFDNSTNACTACNFPANISICLMQVVFHVLLRIWSSITTLIVVLLVEMEGGLWHDCKRLCKCLISICTGTSTTNQCLNCSIEPIPQWVECINCGSKTSTIMYLKSLYRVPSSERLLEYDINSCQKCSSPVECISTRPPMVVTLPKQRSKYIEQLFQSQHEQCDICPIKSQYFSSLHGLRSCPWTKFSTLALYATFCYTKNQRRGTK